MDDLQFGAGLPQLIDFETCPSVGARGKPGCRHSPVARDNQSIDNAGGYIAAYDYKVPLEELGRTTVVRDRLKGHLETSTCRTEPGDDELVLVLEWEQTLIRIPIVADQS